MNKPGVLICLILSTLLACMNPAPQPPPATRSFRMGFQNSAPRPDINTTLQSLDLWTKRADAAMITTEVPWDSLFSGKSPQSYVTHNYVGLVNYYRTKNFKLWVYIDPQNGLNRAMDAASLVARNKSIADADVQKMYRRFVVVMDSMLHPDHLGLALETNLIRVASTPAIYNGVKKAANDVVADVRAVDKNVKLSVSVQVDVAWGDVTKPSTYTGIEQDFTDFPFVEEIGISSYPYFKLSSAYYIPDNYYSKILNGRTIPVFVSEGGWPSKSIAGPNNTTITSNEEEQKNYINYIPGLLKKVNGIAMFQLVFTDVDVSAVPPGVDPNIQYFINLGLVDTQLNPKLALYAWDSFFSLPLKEN